MPETYHEKGETSQLFSLSALKSLTGFPHWSNLMNKTASKDPQWWKSTEYPLRAENRSEDQTEKPAPHPLPFFLLGVCSLPINWCCCYLITKSRLTLCNPRDCSLPGSSVHGISQARILERVSISFFRGSSQPRDQTHISILYLEW